MKVFFEKRDSALSDDELISRIRSGEYEAVGILISRYMPLIIKNASAFSASGLDSDDLIQEGVLAVFSAVQAFDSSKAAFPAFVSLCVKRAIIGAVRAAGALKRIPNQMLSPIDEANIGGGASPEQLYIEKESFKTLADSIRLNLSALEYKVLSLYLEGSSYRQIANSLNIGEKSVDNALGRIRKKLGSSRFS